MSDKAELREDLIRLMDEIKFLPSPNLQAQLEQKRIYDEAMTNARESAWRRSENMTGPQLGGAITGLQKRMKRMELSVRAAADQELSAYKARVEVNRKSRLKNPHQFERYEHGLTHAEHEIYKRVLQGIDNQAIASQIGISKFTVKSHLTRIFLKLRVTSRHELLARYHRELNLVSDKRMAG